MFAHIFKILDRHFLQTAYRIRLQASVNCLVCYTSTRPRLALTTPSVVAFVMLKTKYTRRAASMFHGVALTLLETL